MRIRITDTILTSCIFLSTITIVSSREKTDPCLDRGLLDFNARSELQLPAKYANVTPPWQREDGTMVKVFRSEGFVYHWMWMKSLFVKGLEKSVNDVIDFLSDNNCLFVPVGPAVRQAILGQRTVYLTGEVSCELVELYEKCVKKYRPSVCALYPNEDGNGGTYRLEIGDSSGNHTTDMMRAEPIVLHEWRTILGESPEKWRFTVDTLAVYDNGFGNVVIIDPLNRGFDHICDKKLIPAADDWNHWSKNQPMKVLGFYELRSDGFSAKNESLQKFISDEVNVTDRKIAQKFYCEHILKGVANLEGSTPVCHTKYPDRQVAEKIAEVRTIMIQELGSAWNNSIGRAAEDLEAVFCTDRQFVDIRSRLLHKVVTAHDPKRVPEEPKIIENGLPMVKDNSQIHSRPILNMGAQPPILPPDYPNSPHAQPNENLEIVTPPHVDGAGSDPIAIQEDSKEVILETAEEEEKEDDHEEAPEALSHEIGKPLNSATGIDYTRHNSINNDIPVMRFDKVEEGGLTEVASSAMEISTSSTRDVFAPLLFILPYFLFVL